MGDPAAAAAASVAQVEREGTVRTTRCGAEGRVTWRIWGPPDAPALVLLHGDFGSWTHWLRCIPLLARRFRVIAADMPGYGESDLPPEPWTPESLAAVLAEGLAAILPAPATRYRLAGFSFGGIIAGQLAALEGARVERLALLGPGGMLLPRGTLPALRRPEPGMDAAALRAVHRHNLAALMIADPARVDALAVELQIANVARTRLRAGHVPPSDALLRALPLVRARLSGLWGERDAMAAPHIAEREALLRRFQPGLDFRVIPGAGHWTPYEAPEAVTAALLEMFGAVT